MRMFPSIFIATWMPSNVGCLWNCLKYILVKWHTRKNVTTFLWQQRKEGNIKGRVRKREERGRIECTYDICREMELSFAHSPRRLPGAQDDTIGLQGEGSTCDIDELGRLRMATNRSNVDFIKVAGNRIRFHLQRLSKFARTQIQ